MWWTCFFSINIIAYHNDANWYEYIIVNFFGTIAVSIYLAMETEP